MVDPNEAPEGYVAVQDGGICRGCAFVPMNSEQCKTAGHCTRKRRQDGHSVIFVKRESNATQAPAAKTLRDEFSIAAMAVAMMAAREKQ